MNFSPFIYIGNCGALAEMRRLGFQTFAPYIDESYDAVSDNPERMRLALFELKRLSNLSLDDLHDMYVALWPRLVHNYWRLHREAPKEFSQVFQAEIFGKIGYEVPL